MFIKAAMFTVFFCEAKFEKSFHLLLSSISFNVFNILFLKICPYLCLFLCGFVPMCGVLRDQTRVLDSLELGFQEVVSLLVLGTWLGSSAGVVCVLNPGAISLPGSLVLKSFIQGKVCVDFPLSFLSQHVCYRCIEKWLAFLLILYHVTLLKLFEI